MKLVDRPEFFPHQCAVSLREQDDRGFIDTEMNLYVVEPYIYISVTSVQEMARLIGYKPPEDLQQAEERAREFEARAETAEAQRDALQAQLDAVHVLKQAGYSAQRKPGRKPRVAV